MKTRSNDTIEKIAVDKIYATDGTTLLSYGDGAITIENTIYLDGGVALYNHGLGGHYAGLFETSNDNMIATYSIDYDTYMYGGGAIFIDNNGVDVQRRLYVNGNVLMETNDGASLRMSDIIELEGEEVVISGSTFFNDGVVVLPTYSTLDRPAESVDGAIIYDTTLGLPIVWNGTKWIKFDGTDA